MKNISTSLIKLLWVSALLVSAVSFSSCIKEEYTESDIPNFPDPVELIQSGIMGKVIDHAGLPVKNAELTILSATAQQKLFTGENGSFFIPTFKNKGGQAMLKVEKDGKFKSFKEIPLQKNGIASSVIQLEKKSSVRAFHTSDGAVVETSEGIKITIPANSFGDYSGAVDLFLRWLHTEQPDFFQLELGGRTAVNQGGKPIAIFPLSLFEVEFADINGKQLQPSGEIVVSLPATPVITALPSGELSLYQFFEDGHRWVQKDIVNQRTNQLELPLGDAGLWTLAVLCNKPVTLNGQLQFHDETPGAEGAVIVRTPDFLDYEFHSKIGYGGVFEMGGLPSDFPIELEILDLCGNSIYKKSLGSLFAPVDLGIISPDNHPVTKDLMLDFGFCRWEDMPESGLIIINLEDGNTLLRDFDRANQQIPISYCQNWQNGTFQIVDSNGSLISEVRNVDLRQSQPVVDDVFACYNPLLRLEVRYQLFDFETGDQVANDSLFLQNPEDKMRMGISVDQNFQVTRVRFSADSDCFIMDLDIDFRIPVQIYKDLVDFTCLGFELDWLEAESSYNFEDLATYTGGNVEFEMNVFQLKDGQSGRELMALLEFTFKIE